MNEITLEELDRRFAYHAPDEDRKLRHEGVRSVLRDVAGHLCKLVPPGRDQATMLTKLEEAMFWGNAGIAREPKG